MSAASAAAEAIAAAAASLARTMRDVARMRTDETAASVNVRRDGDAAVIAGGHAGGEWGWEPIQALMFDNNLRHPLFGDRRHWYNQGRFPITGLTARAGAERAVRAFADSVMGSIEREFGFDKGEA